MTDETTGPDPVLWQHLLGARWFAGKGRSAAPGRVHPLAWFRLDDELAVRSELVEAVYPDGTSEWYQVLLSYRSAPAEGFLGTLATAPGTEPPLSSRVHVHDALHDPAALRALVEVLGTGAEAADWSATIVRPVELSAEARVFGGEQSNTSVMIGQSAMVKFFRRLEPGANLDITIHDALGRAGITSVATLHGWLSANLDGDQADLAMLVELLPEARDGWGIATASAAAGDDFTSDAAELGRALADIHLALRDTFPTARLQAGDISAGMRTRLAAAAEEVAALRPLAPALDERFAAVGDNDVDGQQVHGDFHLGQTLLTAKGWRIIDFEGEPIKSLAERRAPDSRWRDAAGMLRSLAYATSACPDPDSDEARSWLAETSHAFLDAYVSGFGGGLGELDQELLDAYLADKAVYEVVYEARNRPDWIEIPLRALRDLAGQT